MFITWRDDKTEIIQTMPCVSFVDRFDVYWFWDKTLKFLFEFFCVTENTNLNVFFFRRICLHASLLTKEMCISLNTYFFMLFYNRIHIFGTSKPLSFFDSITVWLFHLTLNSLSVFIWIFIYISFRICGFFFFHFSAIYEWFPFFFFSFLILSRNAKSFTIIMLPARRC